MYVCEYLNPLLSQPPQAPLAWLWVQRVSDSHFLMLLLIGHHLAPALWLQSTPACIPFSFPLLFPSAVHSPGSGFLALSLACSLPQLGSQWERTLYFLWVAVKEKNTLSFYAWNNDCLVYSVIFVLYVFLLVSLLLIWAGFFIFLIKVFWVPFSHCYVTHLLVCYVWLMLINMFWG